MDAAIIDFIRALRHHGLPVSTAETLDALNATRLIGISDRQRLKTCLSMTLAKTLAHRGQLEALFEQFFTLHSDHLVQPSAVNSLSTADDQHAPLAARPLPIESPLGKQLLNNQINELHRAMVEAGDKVGAKEMTVFLQKTRVSARILQYMGDRELQHELLELESHQQHLEVVADLQQKRQRLVDQVKDYVEQQYLMYSGKKGEQLSEEILHKIKLNRLDHIQQQRMKRLVKKVAKKLASLHSRRRKINKRGLLDVRKTIAANAAFDGYLFHTRWKSTRIERPRLMVICDVSGSVSTFAQFLLLFVYSLQEVFPRTRSFVFSNELVEVTNCFRDFALDEALSLITEQWANHSTDYGRALMDFEELTLKDIDHKTQIIMLGDARNNHDNGRIDLWENICNRAQRVFWLNPENRSNWNTGDSIMREYAPFCSMVEPCHSLRDLERILGRLLKYTS